MSLSYRGKNKANVKLFIDNTQSWEKVQEIRLQRMSNLKQQTKWNQVLNSLPSYFQRHPRYHSDCHKKFTAYSVRSPSNETASTTQSVTTRSTISSSNKPSSSGVLPAKCISCDKGRKNIKGKLVYRGKCEKYETEISIRDAATIHDAKNIQLKVGKYEFGEGLEFVAIEVQYHHECKIEYLNKSRERKKEIAKSIESKAKSVAINEFVRYINTSIIAGNKPEFLSTIFERYKQNYLAQASGSKDVEPYSVQSFAKRLRIFFNEQQLNIRANATKKTVDWKVGSMPFEHATELAKASTRSDFLSIWQCANKSRKDILSLEQKPLEEPLTVENIMDGEVEIRESLKEFYKILYTGNANEQCSARKSHMIEGSSTDAIFACSEEKLIPGKHLSPGLTMKSLTGILNKLWFLY